jgi:transposase
MNTTITIGMDLGNTNHKAVGLGPDGKQRFREVVPNTPQAVREFFLRHAGATVGMETGTHVRWIAALARECGCHPVVGNARKLRLIFESSRKNDWRDAAMLAELCRTNKTLFHPVELRPEERHKLLQMLRMRDALVGARTRLVNSVRGLCKANGVFFPKCSPESFPKHADVIPPDEREMFEPMLEEIEALTGSIRRMEGMIREYVEGHFKEDVELLQTIPGVGLVTSACFVAAIPSVDVFKTARDAGAYFGLVPRQDQSGETDKPKAISKEGNQMVRRNLVSAANHVMRESTKETDLKRFGLRVRGPGNGKVAKGRAKTAVARKLAVIMAAMLKSRKPYDGDAGKRQSA